MSTSAPTDTFSMLEGKTIKTVRIHGVNCVSFETEDGKFFMAETVCVLPTLGLYGMEMSETTKENIVDEWVDRR